MQCYQHACMQYIQCQIHNINVFVWLIITRASAKYISKPIPNLVIHNDTFLFHTMHRKSILLEMPCYKTVVILNKPSNKNGERSSCGVGACVGRAI